MKILLHCISSIHHKMHVSVVCYVIIYRWGGKLINDIFYKLQLNFLLLCVMKTFEMFFLRVFWIKAVLQYCKETQIKSSAIHQECSSYTDEMDDD